MTRLDPQTYNLPVTGRGRMRLTPRLRETYLTPDQQNGECVTQAAGTHVFIWVFSDRDNIRIDLPVAGFACRRPYEQSIHRWGISINRYLSDDATGASVVLTDDEKPTVEAAVDTFETPRAEVALHV